MKYISKITLLLLFVFSMNVFADENKKALDELANKIVYAVKTNDYKKFKDCWVEPDIMINYIRSLSQKKNTNQNYAKIKKYFSDSRKQIEPFFINFQKNIKEYGFNNSEIVYKSAKYKLTHSKDEGYKISSMKINFYFLNNPSQLYHIRIDDAFKIFNKTWLFTDKPLTNMQKQI
jgi:hypothetical protein